MVNPTDDRLIGNATAGQPGLARQQQYQMLVDPRAHLANRRPAGTVASAAHHATTSHPSGEYRPQIPISSYNQPVVDHQHQSFQHRNMSYPTFRLGGASVYDDYTMASTGQGFPDPAFTGGFYGSSLIGNEAQMYGPSLTQNVPVRPQALQESRTFDVHLTPTLLMELGDNNPNILNYFGRSPNPTVSLVITHGVPHEPHDLRLQLATSNRQMAPVVRSSGASRLHTPKRVMKKMANDSTRTRPPTMKRQRSERGNRTRVAGLADSASDEASWEESHPDDSDSEGSAANHGHSRSFEHTRRVKKVRKGRVDEVVDDSSSDEEPTSCNVPGFRNDSTYTSPSRHLEGWRPDNLPPVCGQIIVSPGHKRYTMMRNNEGRLVHGPQGDVLMEIDDDFPNQISSANEDTWQVGTLMAIYPNVPISQFRARMIWDRKGVSALNNRLSAFRESNGMFSITKSCQRTAPTIELDIVHKLSTDQLNRNTGWQLSSCKTMMTQPETKNGNWYPVPFPSADFLSKPQAERLNDTVAKLNLCIQHLQAHNRPVNRANIRSAIEPANRGQKKPKKGETAVPIPYLPAFSTKSKKAKVDTDDEETVTYINLNTSRRVGADLFSQSLDGPNLELH